MSDAVAEFKQRARASWAAGDYPSVAKMIDDVGAAVVQAAGAGPGDKLLDVAAGTGNVAIKAALAGAEVTASDLTPELMQVGRQAATDAGAELEWVEADAEALPFEDESFDAVTSSFGVIFAPRHDVAAGELARVLRPGGRLALSAWTPEGFVGGFFRMMGGFMPPPPDFASPPPMWGNEEHVEKLFGSRGISLQLERRTTNFAFDSVDEMAAFYEGNFGPIVLARPQLEADGRYDELVAALRAHIADANGGEGPVSIDAEYLLVTGTKSS